MTPDPNLNGSDFNVKSLSKEDALCAYARMMNTLDTSEIAPMLAEDFHYSSQWVLTEITSKADYLAYISQKLEAIRSSGANVWAEMGWLEREIPGPCVVLAQGDKDKLAAVVLAKVVDGKIKRLDLCGAPSPYSARRSGVYPGRI